jgi:hypothetical protein
MAQDLLTIAAALATCQTAITARIAAQDIPNTVAAAAACQDLDLRIVQSLHMIEGLLTKGNAETARILRTNDLKLWDVISTIGGML